MPHVVTQACCADASCVYACPVNCIHPTPDEPDFLTSEMLYIDPATCVDCGACVSACPVGAIVPGNRIEPSHERYPAINADHYSGVEAQAVRFPVDPVLRLPLAPISKPKPMASPGGEPVSVAIVGSGPSAMYAADELLRYPNVSVTIHERLDKPFGLARYGVAPDHLSTRKVMALFDEIARDDRLDILLGSELGRDVTLDELQRDNHAVIYAGGAGTDRQLQVPGADLPGVASATDFVGWYNGHPDFSDRHFDLSSQRVVIIGNGNVALDVARILATDPERLASTSISRTALAALRSSKVEEIVVAARRGPDGAAFTLPELIGLADGGVDVTLDPGALDGVNASAATDQQQRPSYICLPSWHIALAGPAPPSDLRSTEHPNASSATQPERSTPSRLASTGGRRGVGSNRPVRSKPCPPEWFSRPSDTAASKFPACRSTPCWGSSRTSRAEWSPLRAPSRACT